MKKFFTFISTMCFIGINAIILLNIVTRTVFNYPFSWTYELSSILIIWGVYIVFGVNHEEGNHFRIDLIKNFLGNRAGKVLDMISNIIIFVTLLFIIYFSFLAIEKNLQMTTMALDFPVSFAFYLPVLIGSLSMMYYILKMFFARRRKKEDKHD